MEVAIISDTHDREKELKELIKKFNKEIKPDILIHCGDLVSPFMFAELANFNGEIHMVPGYQDVGSLLNLARGEKSLCKFNNLTVHDEFGEIEADGKKIAFIHNNKIARLLAETNKYDIVFHGHTHEAKVEKIGDCLLVNPGDIMGRENKPSYALYNTDKNEVELKELT